MSENMINLETFADGALAEKVNIALKEILVKTDIGLFTTRDLKRVKIVKAETLKLSTLTGFVDYIKSKFDKTSEQLLIHVKSHDEVRLYSPLNPDREREEYIRAVAIVPNNIIYDNFLSTEKFNIMLQSSFVDVADKEVLLKYTGLVRDEAVKDTGDDGVSQKVTVKTGITTVGEAIVPNPVTLAPYRTFLEIEQPQSKFIFRMQEGPKAAIYEADGGAWRNLAMQRIKEYLEGQLQDMENIKVIS